MSFSQIPDAGLTLAGVVEFASHTQNWTKLDEAEPLTQFHTQFHAKFWGKCLGGKKRDSDHSKVDDLIVDETDAMDIDDAEINLDNRNDADVDNSDHEFMPGCFELDTTDNPLLPVPRIWIRADYIRVYKYIEARYDRCYSSPKAQPVVITGPPGTGEWLSMSLSHAFYRW
jgi:hypothetical protein